MVTEVILFMKRNRLKEDNLIYLSITFYSYLYFNGSVTILTLT